ncbi:MAG TPA: copper transporter [Acidimicrobiales bacterium]|nr:copper transporter [Acidimicrobiales bacterium]
MINFRYHIVSLTAVFLALGVGLLLGTTFLDDALEDQLRGDLDELQHDLDRAGERNAELRHQLDAFEDEASGLDEQLGARLFNRQLLGQPVLVVAPRGIDEGLVERVTTSLDQADAEVMGTWWLTDRLVLDDDDEVTQLADALDVSTDDAGRLRNSLATQLADVLYGAIDQPAGSNPGSAAGVAGTGQGQQAAPAEPELLARLREAKFVDYDVPDGDGDVVRLPTSGLRIVVVSGPDASVPLGDVLMPMLTGLTSDDQPAPVVAVEPSRVPEDQTDDEPAERLVDLIRDDGNLSKTVSTVDNLDRVSGRVATVLALVDARPGAPTIGHYGTEDGTELLPPVADQEDGG